MKKTVILFISNTVFVVVLSKLLPLFIQTRERNIERIIMMYFLISMIFFLIITSKKNA
jgi:hypothetical protein